LWPIALVCSARRQGSYREWNGPTPRAQQLTAANYDGLEQAIFSAMPVRTPTVPKRKFTQNTVIERPEPRRLPGNERIEPQKVRFLRFYRVPSTYEEGVEAAAALLDDAAKKQTSPEARALVERLAQRVWQELVPPKAQL
jgi:hypothetical protein